MKKPFWKTTPLTEMSQAQWESLCDGCGKCCLISLEDDATGQIYRTDVSCKLFDGTTCRCSDYSNRAKRVTDCVQLTSENIGQLSWMPKTCAYRLIHEGSDLYWWHPLVSGDPETVHTANASVKGKTRPEGRMRVQLLMERIMEWPEPARKPPRQRKIITKS